MPPKKTLIIVLIAVVAVAAAVLFVSLWGGGFVDLTGIVFDSKSAVGNAIAGSSDPNPLSGLRLNPFGE